MRSTNIKNIAIVALAALNLLFLFFCLKNGWQERVEKARARDNLVAILFRNGIELEANGIKDGTELAVLETSRDFGDEKALADALLSNTVMTELGGNVRRYTGERGTAEFRNGGEFTVTLNDKASDWLAHTEKAQKSILSAMKIEARLLPNLTSDTPNPDMAQGAWKGTDIFNCSAEFFYEDGKLAHITGNYPFTVKVTPDTPTDMSSPASAVLALLGAVRDGRYQCREITSVEPGYIFVSVSAYGDGLLCPAWKITADTGVYYYDTVTGKIEPNILGMG